MAREMAISSSATQTEPKRPLMPYKLLKAAIDGNETDLRQLLGLNNEQPPPHTNVVVQDGAPTEPSQSDLLRSVAGMENTILHILSANGHQNLVSTICKEDSSLLKACNVRNETPFHHAARFGHEKTLLKLIECAESVFGEDGLKELLRQKNCLGETALHEAARHGHGAIVSTLMEKDVELAGLVNNDSVSPLYLATARESLDMVRDMVEKLSGQEITPDFYSGPKQQTALHVAVLQYPELTEELLKLYSEPLAKEQDETGRTSLHFVASAGDVEIAILLLDKDPSLVYIPDSDGSFPVHTATRMGHVNMIVLLLQRCLDSGDLLDGNGRNFLHIAIEASKSDIIFKLVKDPNNKLPIPHWKKMFNKMLNTMDNKGYTPLHNLAAEPEDINVMLSLLKNNELDLTLQNKEGLTAFDVSVIQLRKSERTTEVRDVLGVFYNLARNYRFSTGWFQYYTKDKMSKTKSNIQHRILTTDAGGAKTNSESLMAKAQLVGLGSVLIATVTFAAAFTLPGGTNQDTGTPILGRKYVFKAFVLADFYAFVSSFLGTINLIYSSNADKPDRMESDVNASMSIFTFSARCMVIALGLGLYLVLAPICNTGLVIFILSLLSSFIGNPFGVWQQSRWFSLETELLKYIPEAAGGVSPNDYERQNKYYIKAIIVHSYFIFYKLAPGLVPFIIIFLVALI